MKKGKRQNHLAGIIFTGALVAVCVALFLFSDPGAAFLASAGIGQTVYEPTPAPTQTPSASATPKQKEFSVDDFLHSAESMGAAYDVEPVSENARAAVYKVTGSDAYAAMLTLSLQNGSVTAFIFSMDRPHAPAPLAPDASLLYRMEHERQLAEYEEAIEWYCDAITVYALALDHEQTFSHAVLAPIKDMVLSAVEEGKDGGLNAGQFHMDISVTGKDMLEATFYRK